MRLSVFRELLSLRCIKIKNLCAHHQEEVLRIPKHPQLAKFGWFWAELLQLIENKSFPKFVWYLIFKSSICTTLILAVFLAETHPKFASWGCFGILKISSSWWAQSFWKSMQKCLRKLKLMLPTLTWKLKEWQKNDVCVFGMERLYMEAQGGLKTIVPPLFLNIFFYFLLV